jgi:hypothetical protein
MTDIMISQNIDLSSWDSLYICNYYCYYYYYYYYYYCDITPEHRKCAITEAQQKRPLLDNS